MRRDETKSCSRPTPTAAARGTFGFGFFRREEAGSLFLLLIVGKIRGANRMLDENIKI